MAKMKAIPVDQVRVPEVRVTAVYDDEHLALLRSSLEAMGTVNPIIVVATDGGYEVVDGLHRWEEAQRRGDKTIQAVIYEGGPRETLLMNLVLNKVRGKTKASEMVKVIAELWKTHQMDSDAIAAQTGLTRNYIEQLQIISTASPLVQDALDREVIGIGIAAQLARLPAFAQQEEVLAKTNVWRWSVKDLRELVDNTLRIMADSSGPLPGAPPPPPPPPPRFACQGCDTECDPQYLRSVLLCPNCFGHVYRKARGQAETPIAAPGEAQGA